MSEWSEKVRSLGTSFNKGQTKRTVVPHERDGSVAGWHTEHWDDHVDATVTPKPLEITVSAKEE